MIPDKIYLEADHISDREWHWNQAQDGDICYIRKDALIEWLERQNVDRKLIQPIIDKLNSL